MLHVGLDLSRKRLDYHALDEGGACIEAGAAPPDADGLASLTWRLERHGQPLQGAIESMTGARFVHDQLESHGWEVEIADAQKAKGLAPLACKPERPEAFASNRQLDNPPSFIEMRGEVHSLPGRESGATSLRLPKSAICAFKARK